MWRRGLIGVDLRQDHHHALVDWQAAALLAVLLDQHGHRLPPPLEGLDELVECADAAPPPRVGLGGDDHELQLGHGVISGEMSKAATDETRGQRTGLLRGRGGGRGQQGRVVADDRQGVELAAALRAGRAVLGDEGRVGGVGLGHGRLGGGDRRGVGLAGLDGLRGRRAGEARGRLQNP